MNQWQQEFLTKLEQGKQRWQQKFEMFSDETLEPVYQSFRAFTVDNGFSVASPEANGCTRRFKFALAENGYLLMTFRIHGFDEVELMQEIVAPGAQDASSSALRTAVDSADEHWVRRQFEQGLDRFIVRFAEAGKTREPMAAVA